MRVQFTKQTYTNADYVYLKVHPSTGHLYKLRCYIEHIKGIVYPNIKLSHNLFIIMPSQMYMTSIH